MSLFTQDDDSDQKPVVWILLGAVVLLAVSLAMGVGLWRTGALGGKAASEPAAVVADADSARVEVVDGVVQFYFATGKADLAAGAKDALQDVVAAAKAGKQLRISGFHDSTGSAQANADVARNRALAVRDALLAEGVPAEQMNLQKPEVMPDTQGSDARARRVDVAIEE